MLDLLVWLRTHPVIILFVYGASHGWFDGLGGVVTDETWNVKAKEMLQHSWLVGLLQRAHHDIPTRNQNVSLARRLEEKHYTHDAGLWHDAGRDHSRHFVCQGPADEGEYVGGECKVGANEGRSLNDDNCYFVPQRKKSFYGGESHCESFGAKLATIPDEPTNTLVTQLCKEKMRNVPAGEPHMMEIIEEVCWIGLSRAGEGKDWVWQDGTILGQGGRWKAYQNFDGMEGYDTEDKGYEAEREHYVFIIPIDTHWEDPGWIIFIIIVLVSLVITIAQSIGHCIYACQFKNKVTEKRPPLPTVESGTLDPSLVIVHDFKYGLCDNWCWQDCDMCLNTACCYSTRVADTHFTSSTGKGFWFIFCVLEASWILEQVINTIDTAVIHIDINPGWIFAGLIRCCILVQLRQNLRARFGGPQVGGFNDCLLIWCCSLCAACQEGRQVDEAQGVKPRCCCQMIEWRPMQTQVQMVGQPLAIAVPVGQPGTVTVVGQPVQGQAVAMDPTQPQKVPQGVVAGAVPVQAPAVAVPVQAQAVHVQATPVQATLVQATPVQATPVAQARTEDNPNMTH